MTRISEEDLTRALVAKKLEALADLSTLLADVGSHAHEKTFARLIETEVADQVGDQEHAPEDLAWIRDMAAATVGYRLGWRAARMLLDGPGDRR